MCGYALERTRIFLHIEGRIHIIHVFLIQLFPQALHRLAESLEMDHFPFPKEFDHIVHIRIIAEPQNVVIGHTRLLLWERIA